MAKCKKCNQPVVLKTEFCKSHQPSVVAAKNKVLEAQKLKAAKELEERQETMKQMALDSQKKQEQAGLKAAKIIEIAKLWNKDVQAVVTKVKHLRSLHPERTGINAGKNSGIPDGDTDGGTDNPVSFKMPGNTFKITAAEVYSHMTGFEGSDSGSFKFRIDGVFVQGH